MMPQFALFGAAGAIGTSIARALTADNVAFRVVGRSSASLEKSFGGNPLAEIVTWNPDDPASVRTACRGVETLIYLVGVPYNQFQLHPVLMRKTLDGAIAENVKQVVLIGTVYPYGIPLKTPVTEEHPRNPHTFKGKMRKEQEDLLLEADAQRQIEGTILRLPDFYGPGVDRSFLYSLFHAAVHGGTANLVGPIDTPHEFVFVPDVGPVVSRLARTPDAYGRAWNLSGAGAMTQREVLAKVALITGWKPRVRVAGKTALRVLGLFNPLMRELVEMNYLQTTPVLLDGSALCTLLGPVHKTPYDEGIRLCLEAERKSLN